MCGICGLWDLAGGPVDPILLECMRDSMVHRGPDGAGCVFISTRSRVEPCLVTERSVNESGLDGGNEHVDLALGHRRLAIIDLTTGGQPMCNEDRSVWIVFNGEIYNYRELRNHLQKQGYHFRTASDTEVIIRAYEEYGVNCLSQLNGIFTFALWDSKHKHLFLARDHFGVKPLYYTIHNGIFRFASEVKALLADPSVPRHVDPNALNLCLTFRYTPSPYTLFDGISRLGPGSFALIDEHGVAVTEYHRPRSEPLTHVSTADLVEALSARLEAAVQRQMVSDVPISLSLSSGVDSSTLLAIMSRHSLTPVQTLTVGFAGKERTNEIRLAAETSSYFGACFGSQVITDEDYAEFLNHFIWHLEEPIGNESAPAYYFVARMAQIRGIKVLLNGQGPDETFGGYSRHLAVLYGGLLPHWTGRVIGRNGLPLIERLSMPEALHRLAYCLGDGSELGQFLSIYSFISPRTRTDLMHAEVRPLVDYRLPAAIIKGQLDKAPPGTRLERMLYVDARTSLSDNLLLCEDKMAMAASVEARVPFLDIEFMELAERVSGELKVRLGRGKDLHRKVCATFVPPSIAHRPKIGFENAVDLWLRRRLGERLREAINTPNSLTRSHLDRHTVDQLIDEHATARRNHQRVLFLLLSLEAWNEAFIARSPARV